MKVNWTAAADKSPILFARKAEWTGLKVSHWRVLSGEMPEQTAAAHEINVSLAGVLTTEKQTAAGRRRITCGGAGNICLTPAGQSVAASWRDEFECVTLDLQPALINQIALGMSRASNVELVEIYKKRDPLVQHLALALVAETDSQQSAGRIYAESLVQTLVLHLLKNYSAARFAAEDFNGKLSGYRLRRAVEFINAHLDADLSLAEIAEAAGLSQFHFARAFRRTTGQTPQQYLTQQRIERAKELLANGDLPLVEIGLRAGFKNQSHFTRLFRKFTRCTPKVWRELKHA